MRALLRAPLVSVFRTELLLNSKRVAPYVIAVLFMGNALLWWGWGPAVTWGWATNSDFYVARQLLQFSFMTMPFFVALLTGDAVVRDLRLRTDPLIFSKPLRTSEYLLGKFLGNFFVLVCCLACYPLALVALQAVAFEGMLVQPARVLPYVRHFLFFVGVSSLALAALCFTVGTLTRNVRVVYALVTSAYLLYVAGQISLKGLPVNWRIVLDPLLFNVAERYRGFSADALNRLTVTYDAWMYANRALLLLFAAACFVVLRLRFSTTERSDADGRSQHLTTIELNTPAERLGGGDRFEFDRQTPPADESTPREKVSLPAVRAATGGLRAGVRQLLAATGVELRLLLSERSLVVFVPLAVLASVTGLAYYEPSAGPSYSSVYAARAADSYLLFLVAAAVFYTGEALHRDRELRVEPVLWSAPAPDSALLVSKFLTTLLLSLATSLAVFAAAALLQIYKGHAPVELSPYVKTAAVVLLPSTAFATAAVLCLNVVLRDKYLAYAVAVAACVALFYLFNQGSNHWLYNPVLYSLWTPADLEAGAARLPLILTQRLYFLALAALCLSAAHVFYGRASAKGLRAGGRLTGRGWAVLLMLASALSAVFAGLALAGAR